MTGRVSSRHPAVSILGVTLTPCAEGPCETGMSGAAARHFFFLEKVRTVSACIGINLPLKKRPADGGEQPTPPLAALAQASRKCTFAQLAGVSPSPQCRLRAEVTRQRRRKEHEMAEIEKRHHLHIVLTPRQYRLLCSQAKQCRLTQAATLQSH